MREAVAAGAAYLGCQICAAMLQLWKNDKGNSDEFV